MMASVSWVTPNNYDAKVPKVREGYPKPTCPAHGKSMRLVPCPRPRWLLLSLDEPTDRQIWRCARVGCPRVARSWRRTSRRS